MFVEPELFSFLVAVRSFCRSRFGTLIAGQADADTDDGIHKLMD